MKAMNEIPDEIFIGGRRYMLIDSRENIWYRALVIPYGGGDPRWLSNKEVGKLNSL